MRKMRKIQQALILKGVGLISYRLILHDGAENRPSDAAGVEM